MIISLSRLFVLALIVSSICSVGWAREWTSNNGKFKVEAEFVAIKDGKVVLEKPDGTFIAVPLNLISKKDIEYIESTTGKKVTGEGKDKSASDRDSENMSSDEDSSDDKGDRETDAPRVVKPRAIKLKGSKEGDPPGVVRDFGEQGWGIKCLAFSGDGSILVAGKSDEMVSIFDVNEGSRLNITKRLDEIGTIETVAVSQDGTLVVAGGYKGIVKTWRMTRDGALKDGVPFAGHSEQISAIAISPDGRFALSGSRDKSARYWQVSTGKEFEAYADFENEVKAVWISADGLEGKATDGVVLAKIDLKTKEAVTTRIRDRASIQFAAFSPDGRYLAMNDSYTIRMWDLKTSKEMPAFKSNEIQWTGVFTPDGTRLISGASGILNVWDVQTQKRIGVLTNEGNGYVQAIAVSPDGEHVAGCASGASVNLRVFRLPAP